MSKSERLWEIANNMEAAAKSVGLLLEVLEDDAIEQSSDLLLTIAGKTISDLHKQGYLHTIEQAAEEGSGG